MPAPLSLKCELCPRQAMFDDILCGKCLSSFDPMAGRNRIAAESIDPFERNAAAAGWLCDTYGPVFAARFGVDND